MDYGGLLDEILVSAHGVIVYSLSGYSPVGGQYVIRDVMDPPLHGGGQGFESPRLYV